MIIQANINMIYAMVYNWNGERNLRCHDLKQWKFTVHISISCVLFDKIWLHNYFIFVLLLLADLGRGILGPCSPPPLFDALFLKNVPTFYEFWNCAPPPFFLKTAIYTTQKVSESHGTMVYGSDDTMAPESVDR